MGGGRGDALRVLLTVHHRLVEGQGAPGATLAIAEALESLGHHVDVVGLDLLRANEGSTADQVRFPHAVARIVRRHFERGDVDVVDASTGDLAWVDARRVRASSVAVLTRSHGLEPLAAAARRVAAASGELALRRRYGVYHGGLRLREVVRSLRAADGVLVLNAAEERYATARLEIPAERVWRTAPLVRSSFSPVARDESRDLLVLGADAWRKGGDVAVRVLDAVLRAHPQVTATWAGLDDVGALRAKLGHDVVDRVALEGHYDPGGLARLLGTHRVLVFPSRFEGLPVTLLEATTAGIPTVGADIGGVRDLLEGGAGVLVPASHVEGFVAATAALLADPPARARCVDAARDTASRYARDAVVARLVEAYRTLLAVKRPPG